MDGVTLEEAHRSSDRRQVISGPTLHWDVPSTLGFAITNHRTFGWDSACALISDTQADSDRRAVRTVLPRQLRGGGGIHAAGPLTCYLRLPLWVEGVGHCVQCWTGALSWNGHPHPHPLELGKAVWEEASLRRVLQFLTMPCGVTQKCFLGRGLHHWATASCNKTWLCLLFLWPRICQ